MNSMLEELHRTYRLPVRTEANPTEPFQSMICDRDAIVAEVKDKDLMRRGVRCLQRTLFGASEFCTRDRVLHARKICPQIGGTGWARYPGCDHWEVRRNGEVVFRTQNYGHVLRYFEAYVRRHDQTPHISGEEWAELESSATKRNANRADARKEQQQEDRRRGWGKGLGKYEAKSVIKTIARHVRHHGSETTATAEKDLTLMSVVAERARSICDLQGNPTGWKAIDYNDGCLLVSEDGRQQRRYESADKKSGTELMLAKLRAANYAVDHPYKAPAAILIEQPEERELQVVAISA